MTIFDTHDHSPLPDAGRKADMPGLDPKDLLTSPGKHGAGDGGDFTEGDDAPILSQDEIDSLLTFDDGEPPLRALSGTEAILNSSLITYERLPMLEVVFDRLARLLSTSLRNLTSDNVEVTTTSISTVRFGDHLASVRPPVMIGVIRAEEWDNLALAVFDPGLVYAIIDVLLGGRSGTAAMRVDGRPFTAIERGLIERVAGVIVSDLSTAFAPLCPVTFQFDRLESNPRFATISRPSNATIRARFQVEMDDRGGEFTLLIPYATLEPIRELLLQMFSGEKFGRDSIWESHLSTALWTTEVEMTAVMDERILPLQEIFDLKVGSRIMFDATPDTLVELRCSGIPMYTAKMGRRGNRLAVQIENRTPSNEGEQKS